MTKGPAYELSAETEESTADAVVRATIELLESGGYDVVELREVARRARTSLTTIYKLFPTRRDLVRTRESLIVTALEQWMAANAYAGLETPTGEESMYDALMRVFRKVFEPWERNPRMLEAYFRARSGPGGERLPLQGATAAVPVLHAILEDCEPAFVDDFNAILTNLVYGLIGRYADGELAITDILSTLERAVARLTNDDAPPARTARGRQSQGPTRR